MSEETARSSFQRAYVLSLAKTLLLQHENVAAPDANALCIVGLLKPQAFKIPDDLQKALADRVVITSAPGPLGPLLTYPDPLPDNDAHISYALLDDALFCDDRKARETVADAIREIILSVDRSAQKRTDLETILRQYLLEDDSWRRASHTLYKFLLSDIAVPVFGLGQSLHFNIEPLAQRFAGRIFVSIEAIRVALAEGFRHGIEVAGTAGNETLPAWDAKSILSEAWLLSKEDILLANDSSSLPKAERGMDSIASVLALIQTIVKEAGHGKEIPSAVRLLYTKLVVRLLDRSSQAPDSLGSRFGVVHDVATYLTRLCELHYPALNRVIATPKIWAIANFIEASMWKFSNSGGASIIDALRRNNNVELLDLVQHLAATNIGYSGLWESTTFAWTPLHDELFLSIDSLMTEEDVASLSEPELNVLRSTLRMFLAGLCGGLVRQDQAEVDRRLDYAERVGKLLKDPTGTEYAAQTALLLSTELPLSGMVHKFKDLPNVKADFQQLVIVATFRDCKAGLIAPHDIKKIWDDPAWREAVFKIDDEQTIQQLVQGYIEIHEPFDVAWILETAFVLANEADIQVSNESLSEIFCIYSFVASVRGELMSPILRMLSGKGKVRFQSRINGLIHTLENRPDVVPDWLIARLRALKATGIH